MPYPKVKSRVPNLLRVAAQAMIIVEQFALNAYLAGKKRDAIHAAIDKKIDGHRG